MPVGVAPELPIDPFPMNQTRSLLLIAWLFLAYLLWDAWNAPPRSESPLATLSGESADLPTARIAAPDGEIPAAAEIPSGAEAAAMPAGAAVAATKPATLISLHNDVLRLTIDLRGGNVVGAELLDFGVAAHPHSPRVQLLSNDPARLFVAQSGVLGVGGASAPTHETPYTLVLGNDESSRTLEWSDGNGLSVRKVFRLDPGSYELHTRYEITNAGSAVWQGQIYRQLLRVPPVIANAGFNNPETYSFAGVAWYSPGEKYEKRKFADLGKTPLAREVTGGWIAMPQHHFVAAWIPPSTETAKFSTVVLNGSTPRYVIREVGAIQKVGPGQSLSEEARLWVGPKLQHVLPNVAPGLERTVDYGIFTLIAEPLFVILSWLHALFGNWGWAIIALVVLIKALFFKLSEKQFVSMARMRKLQPRMEALKERYGDDRQKYQQAVFELYKKEKVNPVGGCLPLLLQFPVFLALYWVLLESVELRHAPWVGWIHSLTDKDPYFVLPVLYVLIMFFTQRLSPTPGMDPMQRKMMQAMPIVFGVMFAFFPAGLVLYWVTNGALGLLQQWLIMRRHGEAHGK